MRSNEQDVSHKHLLNSLATFLRLVECARSLDRTQVQQLIDARDYEELDVFILNHLMGK